MADIIQFSQTTTGRKSCICLETQQITFTAVISRRRHGRLLTQCTSPLLRGFENICLCLLAVMSKQFHGLFLHQTEKFPTPTICIINISAPSNSCYLKNEPSYFSYRRKIKKLPLHHQAVQSSLCSKLESQASDGLVVPQDKNHTLVNALISFCSWYICLSWTEYKL